MKNHEEERMAYLSFACFGKIGEKQEKKLLNYFSCLKKAYCASYGELKMCGLNEKIISDFFIFRKNFLINDVLNDLINDDIRFICSFESSYPKILKEINYKPLVIFYKGDLSILENKSLSVVGSRKHSSYGERVINEILPVLSGLDINITSGLAMGIDSLAHRKALEKNIKTVAVLGSGLDKKSFYPRQNVLLAKNILNSGGLIISEFPPQTPPLKQNFPRRNRLISGLSQATLIIEAKEKSGSLITAGYALDQNRDILVIPANIFSEFSKGSNKLISKGAIPINSGVDLLEYFGLDSKLKIKKTSFIPENKNEELIYQIINKYGEISSDEISLISQLDTGLINSTLSILEIKEVLTRTENSYRLS